MKKAMVSFAVVLVALSWCVAASSMAREHTPGSPIRGQSALADLLNSEGRVYGFSTFGGNSFFFSGDTEDFNQFLERYGKLKGSGLTLVLRPGQGSARKLGAKDKHIPFDWKVTTWLFPKASPRPPLLELWVGGKVELSKVKLPANVSVGSGGSAKKSAEIEQFIAAHRPKGKQAGESETPPAVPVDTTAKPETPKPASTTLTTPASFQSRRLLYGKLSLTEDRSKILSMVLDESNGTRTGHDLLYADVNFNGTFEESEKLTAVKVKRHGSWLSTASFAALNFDVPYNEEAQGIANPCQVSLGYRQYPRAGVAEDFSVTMRLKLKDGTTVWDYSARGSARPSKRPEDAVIWTLPGPRMGVATQPDKNKNGHLGIAIEVSVGEGEFDCRKGGLPIEAHVEIKKPDGEIVHRGDATPDKFRFG